MRVSVCDHVRVCVRDRVPCVSVCVSMCVSVCVSLCVSLCVYVRGEAGGRIEVEEIHVGKSSGVICVCVCVNN